MSGRDRYNVNQWYDVTTKKGRRYRNQQQSARKDSEVEVDCIMSDTVVVGEKIGTSQNSGGDSVSEGSQHGGNDLPSNPAIDILTNIPDVHEVFSHHLNEGCKGSDKKKKRGKFARKKADTSKSISPSDQERPKKRQRDSGDPFDLDRFIFPVNGNALVENETKDGDESIHEFLTLDLNRDILDVEVEPSAGRNYVVSEDDHIAAQRLEEVLNEEVNDTINLAKTLGASNIDDFEGDLKKFSSLEGLDIGRYFLCIRGVLKETGKGITFINVYSPQKLVDKRLLWTELERIIVYDQEFWIIGGDFNCVRDRSERRNSKFIASVSNEFNEFIDKVGLHEFMLKGRKFTFVSGNKCSRIDRFLVSWSVINEWSNAEYRALARDKLDHSPLVLKVDVRNYGAKPFRFYNSWLLRPDLEDIVARTVSEFRGCGAPDIVLMNKFKMLRQEIVKWRKNKGIEEAEEEANLHQELIELDAMVEDRDLTDAEQWMFVEAKKRLKELEEFKAKDMRQKARLRWAKEGDENTSFFHGLINKRRVSNNISGVMVNGNWVFKPSEVKREVYGFFRKRFVEDLHDRPALECYGLKHLDDDDVVEMVRPFDEKEIKDAVFECGSDKAPGPDGFNFRFVKRFWSILSHDFVSIMKNFFRTGIINRGVGSSFISLIPKVSDPTDLGEYRPINLIGVISKVISKVLANRLKKVMGKVTHETESAFLSGRYILDGPLIISEILAWATRMGKELFMFKIDFEKAYDNVHWEFLISVMRQMKFLEKWCMWIKGVLESARSSVLVNGSPTFEFGCGKGIRQGDPMSPFLFIIVMEALSCMLRRACDTGSFHGVCLPNGGLIVSHLLYADDAMVMGEWSQYNFKALKRILRIFHLCSGLRINLHKSSLFGLGKNMEDVVIQASDMGCRSGETPFKYLGILVGANMSRISSWEPVVEVFKKRLSRWKANILSMGGRVILIKSVLESLPTYYFSLYKAPAGVISKLEVIIKRFLWGGNEERDKVHWVAWDTVTKTKRDGGLGLNKLQESNSALLLKWLWRYRVEYDAHWRKVIDAVHGSARRWETFPCNKRFSGTWSKLVSFGTRLRIQGNCFVNMIRGNVGNGRKVRFWIDPWITDEPLKDLFPDLFRLEKNKWCFVDERIGPQSQGRGITWRWEKYPNSSSEVDALINCHRMVADVNLDEKEDRWFWYQGSSVEFSIKEVRKWLKGADVPDDNSRFMWCKWIPNKCNIFMWRAGMDRIPTQYALRRRNIYVGDGMCVFCGEVEETSDHLFSACRLVDGVWNDIVSWCKIPPIYVFSTNDVLQIVKYAGGSKAKQDILYGVIILACWRIWKARNKKIFTSKGTKVIQIVSDVKSLGFLWFRSRYKGGSVEWKDWCNFYFPLM
ncbi:hypothetical protein L1987_45415 [Smallanthus sonchifolius]|uniref:Uncharacterized protein n=1 Tax=Smallanthus sonchifolius TaxID=185202 RepID=A0ACB9FXY1_9ASTR|nr:hypothetical protein L1987_45415 [Smallanthus sonchifolius]